jgi:hypothetical protein
MFLAQALLSATHGKDSETRELAPLKANKIEVVTDQPRFSAKTLTGPACGTVTGTDHDKVPHVVTSADSQFQESRCWERPGFTNRFVTAGTNSSKEARIVTPNLAKD